MAALDAPREVSAARIVSQGLAAPLPDPVAAVEALLAIQGQQPSAIPWAIGVRADIEDAFERVELVRSWPMRGTVHVTSARDHHWLRACLVHRYSAWLAQTTRNGLAQSVVDRAGQLAVEEIARSGPRTRAQLIEVWQDAGIVVDGPRALRDDAPGSPVNRRHLMVRLHIDGVLAQGPVRGNEHLVVDASSLPAAGDVAKGGAAHDEALARLAERYARGHGPVSAQDLARWASLPVSGARRALAAAVEASRGGEAPIVERSRGFEREDLPDLVAGLRRRADGVFALPSFDELHVGYRDRSCLTDEAGERAICPSRNGMFRPIVVRRGRVVAVRLPSGGLEFLDGACATARSQARAAMERRMRWLA